MTQTTSRSGVPFLVARDISQKIALRVRAEKKGNRTVTAARLRRMVAGELRDRNQSDLASSYEGGAPYNPGKEPRARLKEQILGSEGRDSVLHDRSKRPSSTS